MDAEKFFKAYDGFVELLLSSYNISDEQAQAMGLSLSDKMYGDFELTTKECCAFFCRSKIIMATSPEFKRMIGKRLMNSDGYTYGYGRANEYSTTYRHKESVARCRRADKRGVKFREMKRVLKDEE